MFEDDNDILPPPNPEPDETDKAFQHDTSADYTSSSTENENYKGDGMENENRKDKVYHSIPSELLKFLEGHLDSLENLLEACNLKVPQTFSQFFGKRESGLRQVGLGSFSKLFKSSQYVYKIINISSLVQFVSLDLVGELYLTKRLSSLRNGIRNKTLAFPKLIRSSVIWDFDLEHLEPSFKSEKKSKRLYIVHCMKYAGNSLLEEFISNDFSAGEIFDLFKQIALALAVSENALKFEHRDLHEENILIKKTEKEEIHFRVNGSKYSVKSNGYKVTVVDFTLSRANMFERVRSIVLNLDANDYRDKIIKKNWKNYFPQTNCQGIYEVMYRLASWSEIIRKGAFFKWVEKEKNNVLEIKNCLEFYKFISESSNRYSIYLYLKKPL